MLVDRHPSPSLNLPRYGSYLARLGRGGVVIRDIVRTWGTNVLVNGNGNESSILYVYTCGE